MQIEVSKPDAATLESLGALEWPIWEKGVSTFEWHYDEQETCYLLAGRVRVEPAEGEGVVFGTGDLVIFPKGMSCTWTITEPVRKHFRFD